MADVTIQSCTLRLVRHGGWSWGPDVRGLLQDVVGLLPQLLERQLANQFDMDEDAIIESPLHIRIPVRLVDLRAVVRNADRCFSAAAARDLLEQRFSAALRRAIGQVSVVRRVPADRAATMNGAARTDRTEPGTNGDARDTSVLQSTPHARSRLLEALRCNRSTQPAKSLLIAWHEDGRLAARLRTFELPALRAWHDRLLARPGRAGSRRPVHDAHADVRRTPRSRIAQAMREILTGLDLSQAPITALLRARIVAAIEVSQRLHIPLSHPLLREILDIEAPLANAPAVRLVDGDDNQRRTLERSAVAAPLRVSPLSRGPFSPSRSPIRIERPAGEHRIESALPFLIAGSLDRLGWLDVMSGVLDAAGALDQWPELAAAIAYKVLSPVQPGGLRSMHDLRSAAVFAGVAEAFPGGALLRLARRLQDQISPANGAIARAVMEGRNTNGPLLLAAFEEENDGVCSLFDVDGVFPVLWGGRMAEIITALEEDEAALLLVNGVAATPDLLDELHRAGLRFVAEGPAARAEPWREFRDRDGGVWITNDRSSAARSLVVATRSLEAADEAAVRLWHELGSMRWSVRPDEAPHALDRSLSLATSVALGDIAWRLWHERETTDPVLALKRFGDLSARVFFDAREARVLLPLGQRSSDLDRYGLLREIREAPWLNGRRIVFGRG